MACTVQNQDVDGIGSVSHGRGANGCTKKQACAGDAKQNCKSGVGCRIRSAAISLARGGPRKPTSNRGCEGGLGSDASGRAMMCCPKCLQVACFGGAYTHCQSHACPGLCALLDSQDILRTVHASQGLLGFLEHGELGGRKRTKGIVRCFQLAGKGQRRRLLR